MAAIGYEVEGNRMFRINGDGERELLANFDAQITEEVRIVDGLAMDTRLVIAGRMTIDEEEVDLPGVEVPSEAFAGMGWVMRSWGVRAVITPGQAVKDDLRAAIQLQSKPTLTTIYRHTGWTEIDGNPFYLHAGGGISKKGNNPNIRVQLPTELGKFDLTQPDDLDPKACVQAVLDLTRVGPREVTWPLLAAGLAPLYGPVDFAVHLTGRTGTFKSEVMSLFQSLYGKGMDARHLPGSWSSTANAIEAQAFLAKNAAFVVDDFVPAGTSWQVRAYQTNADKIIRSQGNQAGRARMNDTMSLQTAMYPRGVVLSTGEDTPEGHSVRARMLILELSPGDVDVQALTRAQKSRPLLSGLTATLVQSLAETPQDLSPRAEEVRDQNLGIGHTRTPGMVGRLVAVAEAFISWCRDEGYLTKKEANWYAKDALEGIMEAAGKQMAFLEAADPVDVFLATIRQVFSAGLGHVRTLNGGIPRGATQLGWTQEGTGDIPTFKSHGPSLGWVSWNDGELYLDITGGYAKVKAVAKDELALTKQTMLKRLKDAGVLTRTDDARQRNTVRVTAEGHARQVLSMNLTQVLDSQEVPQDERAPGEEG